MSRYRLSRRAQRDLIGFRNWIEEDNPDRAVSYIEEIRANLGRLAERPLMGRGRPEMGPDYRSMPHGNYLIFYRLASYGIDVLRVVHSSRDLRRGLQ